MSGQRAGVEVEKGPDGRYLDLEGLRSVRVRPARTKDVAAIARLHGDVLPGAFLPLLGARFLRVLFRAHVKDPDAVAVVAELAGEVIGYACGVRSMPAFRRRLVVRNAVPLIVAVLPHLLRPARLRRLLQTAAYPEKTRGLPEAEWAFVGVRRGTAPGLGTELGKSVLAALADLGVREAKGYVACDNRAMNSMVRRMGFELRAQISLHDGRMSNVYVIRLDGGDASGEADGERHSPTRGYTVGRPSGAAAAAPAATGSGTGAGAVHLDPRTGSRTEAMFFGDDGSRMLGFLHTPPHRPVAGVVICSPIGAEFLRNHRREVLLARSLAASGVAVQRFHYRGSGSSDGEAEGVTFETMIQDAAEATALLQRRTGVSSVAFVGTRLGAWVAAAMAAGFPGAPVALWEPALDGRRYLDEVFRMRLVQGLKDEDGQENHRDDFAEELRRRKVIDVLGNPLTIAFYDSVRSSTLAGVLGPRPRPVLLYQIGRRPRLRREYGTVAARWQDDGFEVDTHVFVHPFEAWWFSTPDESAPPGRRMVLQKPLLDTTEQWLRRRLTDGGRT